MPSDCPKAPIGGPHPTLQTITLPAGTPLVRFQLSASTYPANSFNPNTGKDWTKPRDGARFNPFPDAISKANVPSIYVADTFAAAALESVFHGVPHEPSPAFARSQLAAWCFSEFRLNRKLTVFSLTNPSFAN
jgi:hypothetical protein